MPVLPQDIETYERDGVVLFRQAFDSSWIAALKEGFKQDLAAPGPMSRHFADEGDGKRFFWDTILWPRIDAFRHFAENSDAAEMAATLMGSDEVRVINDVIFHRTAGTQARSPFHQDRPYLCFTGSQCCSLWMPLVPVSAESALAFVPGSHRSGVEYGRARFGEALDNDDSSSPYHEMPDIETDPTAHGVVSWDMEPGDCVFFHGLTIHGGSGRLPPDRELIAFSINWVGDDARVRIRPGGMEPDLSAICAHHGLRDGDRLACDGFPLVWPRTI